MKTNAATLKRVYAMSLASVYPHYVAKAEKKGRTKAAPTTKVDARRIAGSGVSPGAAGLAKTGDWCGK